MAAATAALVAALVATPALAAGIATSVPGDMIQFFSDPEAGARPLVTQVQRSGPTLLFSDDPEYLSEPGILYRDSVSGPFRVFLDHVYQGKGHMVFTVLVSNPGTEPVTVSVGQAGIGGPGGNYLGNGQAAQRAWLLAPPGPTVTIAPGQSTFLDPALNAIAAGNNGNVTAIVDGTANGLVTIAVVAQRKPVASLAGLDLLPARRPNQVGFVGRGTFRDAGVQIRAAGNGSAELIDLGSTLQYLTGFSAVDGLPTEDYGNYGVLYDLAVREGAGRDERLAAIFVPHGGAFAGAVSASLGFSLGQIVDVPSGGGFIPGKLSSVLVGQYQLKANAAVELHYRWMPPAGSFLPAKMLFAQY